MGFELEDRELMTSLGACRQIVDERGLKCVFGRLSLVLRDLPC